MSMKEVNFTWLLPEGANPRSTPILIVIAETIPPCKYQRKLQENSFKFQNENCEKIAWQVATEQMKFICPALLI